MKLVANSNHEKHIGTNSGEFWTELISVIRFEEVKRVERYFNIIMDHITITIESVWKKSAKPSKNFQRKETQKNPKELVVLLISRYPISSRRRSEWDYQLSTQILNIPVSGISPCRLDEIPNKDQGNGKSPILRNPNDSTQIRMIISSTQIIRFKTQKGIKSENLEDTDQDTKVFVRTKKVQHNFEEYVK